MAKSYQNIIFFNKFIVGVDYVLVLGISKDSVELAVWLLLLNAVDMNIS